MENVMIIAMVQATYDFAGWYGIFKENDGHKYRLYFRVTKELLDFIVMPVILLFYFDVSAGILTAFFVSKWCHLCDSFYNIWRYILTNEPTSVWGYWRWWTPLGLLRCNWWGFCIIKGYTESDYNNKTGNWATENILSGLLSKKAPVLRKKADFSRGMVSIKESWVQTGIGLVLASIILYFV